METTEPTTGEKQSIILPDINGPQHQHDVGSTSIGANPQNEELVRNLIQKHVQDQSKVMENDLMERYGNLPPSLASTLLNMPTNIYIESVAKQYNYNQAMLTAELLKRNERMNQEAIA